MNEIHSYINIFTTFSHIAIQSIYPIVIKLFLSLNIFQYLSNAECVVVLDCTPTSNHTYGYHKMLSHIYFILFILVLPLLNWEIQVYILIMNNMFPWSVRVELIWFLISVDKNLWKKFLRVNNYLFYGVRDFILSSVSLLLLGLCMMELDIMLCSCGWAQ